MIRERFFEFARAELATGGPDPQVELTAQATFKLDLSERDAAVFAGCFVTPYTCGAAGPLFLVQAAMNRRGAPSDVDALHQWVEANWAGLPSRRERRAVWNKRKFAESLLSWIDWVDHDWPKVRALPYPEVYASVQKNVQYYGRYATMKVIEVLFQRHLVDHQQSDIRPDGAKYPRRTLADFFPDVEFELTSNSSRKDVLQIVDACASTVKEEAGIESWFDFETLLCNYRQSLAGKYPGRSHDRELAHYLKASNYWGPQLLEWFPFYGLREEMFPRECLGELGDPPWWGARKELEVAYKEKMSK